MAYNKKNRLLRIIHIQEIALEHQRRGVSNKIIYERYIRPVYHISRRTFDAYLSVPARRQLLELEQKSKSDE